MSVSITPAGASLAVSGHASAISELVLDLPRPRTRGPVLVGVIGIAVFVGAFGLWSAVAPLSEAAIAPGTIKAEGNRRSVQHLEGGIVREILTRDGEAVRAGQVLMRLDAIQSDAGMEAVRGAFLALRAQDARLASELVGATTITFPSDLLANGDPRAREAVVGQRVLFATRLANLNSQVQALRARLSQHEATIASARGQVASQHRQLALLRREEADVRALVAQGLERIPRLLGLQRQIAAAEGNVVDLTGQMDRAAAQISETEHQLQGLRDQRMQEVSAEARDVHVKLQDTEERLRAAADVATRREIVAPEDGTVLSSRFFNPGAVLRPGETVLELVPARDRLVAEVRVSPTDIDVVHEGLLAEVRLPAFKQRLVPYLHGRVTFVGGDVNQDQPNMPEYYRAQIVIDAEQLQGLTAVSLRPGMPVEAQIQIGERSFFRYMIQPFVDSFHRAFREQ